jgi:hypothetical protein
MEVIAIEATIEAGIERVSFEEFVVPGFRSAERRAGVTVRLKGKKL